jgi:hypothetical protein
VELDGIVTFVSSYHALRSERAVLSAGVTARLVPAPRDLSPTCVTALRFPWPEAERVRALLAGARIEVDQLVHYPEAQARPAGWSLFRKESART